MIECIKRSNKKIPRHGAKSFSEVAMSERNTILIVDDYEFNRLLLSEMFPERNILEAADGAEGITMYEKNRDKICAVLTDIMMPRVDGLGLLDFFSKAKYITEVPVFVISADSSNKVITKAFQLGVEDVITKPFNVNFVKKHIDHIIELYELRRAVEGMSGTDITDDDFV